MVDSPLKLDERLTAAAREIRQHRELREAEDVATSDDPRLGELFGYVLQVRNVEDGVNVVNALRSRIAQLVEEARSEGHWHGQND